MNNKKFTTKNIIERLKKIYGNKYDLSKVEYVNFSTPMTIICPIHGEFKKTLRDIKRSKDCPKCKKRLKQIKRNFYVLEEIKNIYRDKYDLSKVKYINNYTPMTFVCPTHGEFKKSLKHVRRNQGCPKCKSYKGEQDIMLVLDEMCIKYYFDLPIKNIFPQIKKHKRKRFDFVLPEQKIIIEYDGEQHFFPVKFNNKEEDNRMIFIDSKKRDYEKDKIAKEIGFRIFRISYQRKDEVKQIVSQILRNQNNKIVLDKLEHLHSERINQMRYNISLMSKL